MSLSFVSKSVLTAKADGGYEETAVEGAEEGSSSTRTTSSQPLFEQLRANKEQEESEREEFQKSIMRGTLALDEEDCAHLDAIQKQRHERDQAIRKETMSELEAFRAAQAVSRMEQGVMKEEDDEDDEHIKVEEKVLPQKKPSVVPTIAKNKPKFPTIIAKKRRKQPTKNEADQPAKKPKKEEAAAVEEKKETPSSFSGLLAGYGSSDDSD